MIPVLGLYAPRLIEQYRGRRALVRVTAICRDTWGRMTATGMVDDFGAEMHATLRAPIEPTEVDTVELAVMHRDEWVTVAGWSVGEAWRGIVSLHWPRLVRAGS